MPKDGGTSPIPKTSADAGLRFMAHPIVIPGHIRIELYVGWQDVNAKRRSDPEREHGLTQTGLNGIRD